MADWLCEIIKCSYGVFWIVKRISLQPVKGVQYSCPICPDFFFLPYRVILGGNSIHLFSLLFL